MNMLSNIRKANEKKKLSVIPTTPATPTTPTSIVTTTKKKKALSELLKKQSEQNKQKENSNYNNQHTPLAEQEIPRADGTDREEKAPNKSKNKLSILLGKKTNQETLTTKWTPRKKVEDPIPPEDTITSIISKDKDKGKGRNQNEEEEEEVIQLDPSQKEAIEILMNNKYSCLIGAAGTGKTFSTLAFLEKLLEAGIAPKDVFLGAFMGVAVDNLQKAIPSEFTNVGTIHGKMCLAFEPAYETTAEGKTRRVFLPTRNASNPLPYKILILDEAGTISIDLWNTLMNATQRGTKIILIGDINQLPPVYGRSVLGYAMTKWPTAELTKIHRQALNNPIIANSQNVLQGKFPLVDKKRKLFQYVELPPGSAGATHKFLGLISFLFKNGLYRPSEDGIITPQNKNIFGQLSINANLSTLFNPEGTRKIINTGIRKVNFAVGDKVMVLSNNADKNYKNGQIGYIRDIAINGQYKGIRGETASTTKDFNPENLENVTFTLEAEQIDSRIPEEELKQRQASHICYVELTGTSEKGRLIPFSTAGDFNDLALAYAFTCHKAQGREYPTVIIFCHSVCANLLCREWLYTAITRARERVILAGNDRGLSLAVGNQRIRGKNLAEKVQSFLNFSEAQSKLDPQGSWAPILGENKSWDPANVATKKAGMEEGEEEK